MPSYNVAAALLALVGIIGGAAYRAKPRSWVLWTIAGLAAINFGLTPYVLGKVVFATGFVWIMWVLRRDHARRVAA